MNVWPIIYPNNFYTLPDQRPKEHHYHNTQFKTIPHDSQHTFVQNRNALNSAPISSHNTLKYSGTCGTTSNIINTFNSCTENCPRAWWKCLCSPVYRSSHNKNKQTNSVALSPRANYTDWATATCWRNLVPTFADRGVSHGQRGGSPTVVNLSFLDRSRYFSFK
jgi:hypothetical protein